MTDKPASLRSHLSSARGIGAARAGTMHWWWQRVTAIILVPLMLFLVYSLLSNVVGKDRAAVAEWMSSPLVAVAMFVGITAIFYHARLGIQVVIEDYVHGDASRTFLLIGNAIIFPTLTVIGWISVLKLHIVGI